MQHARQPVGRGKVIRATHKNEQFNHLCGDHIILSLQVENEVVMDAAFEGEACAICTASASLLCKHAAGQTVQEIQETRSWLESALHGSVDSAEHEMLLPLLGVRSYPSRIRCALLPWDALAGAL
jgi:nitrogen fixation NifU-like protein